MSVTDETKDRVTAAIFAGRKLEAIKLYRAATGQGLKESKLFVEELTKRLREEHPDRVPAESKGCSVTVASGIFLTVLLAYTWWT